MTQEMSDDVFFEKYTCVENPFTKGGSFDNCLFETYGEDHQFILLEARINPASVWTVIDNNEGWYGIIAGYHFVNRLGYLITEQGWDNEEESYCIQNENNE